MKRALLLVAILGLAASPALAQSEGAADILSFRISGSVIVLGDPMAGPFQVLSATAGKGPLGGVTGQGFYVYVAAIGGDGTMIGGPSQLALRFEATGDTMLLQLMPGPTGTMVPAVPGSFDVFTWNQTWTGIVVGGTGRFAGATGTFVKNATGLIVMPGFVSPWEGTIAITLDPK